MELVHPFVATFKSDWSTGRIIEREKLLIFDIAGREKREWLANVPPPGLSRLIDLECVALRHRPDDGQWTLVLGDQVGDIESSVAEKGTSQLAPRLVNGRGGIFRQLWKRCFENGIVSLRLRDIRVSLVESACEYVDAAFCLAEAGEFPALGKAFGFEVTEHFCQSAGLVDTPAHRNSARVIMIRFDSELRAVQEISIRFCHLQPILATGDLHRAFCLGAAISAVPTTVREQFYKSHVRCDKPPGPHSNYPLVEVESAYEVCFGVIDGALVPRAYSIYRASLDAPNFQLLKKLLCYA